MVCTHHLVVAIIDKEGAYIEINKSPRISCIVRRVSTEEIG